MNAIEIAYVEDEWIIGQFFEMDGIPDLQLFAYIDVEEIEDSFYN
jgi:hypothetical protein